MTAEIVVMNSEAVALAADSAVTSWSGSVEKISSSANKLFALSTCHPVGVMIYGKATFMDVPWETIIKVYRSASLPPSGFDTLEEYANDFISYLRHDNIQFPEIAEHNYVAEFVEHLLYRVRQDITKQIEEAVSEGRDIDDRLLGDFTNATILRYHREYHSLADSMLPLHQGRAVIRKYRRTVDYVMDGIFSGFNLSSNLCRKLRETLAHAFSKSFSEEDFSGIVIAGFGEKEFRPTVRAFKVEGIVCLQQRGQLDEVLKWDIDDEHSLLSDVKAGVVAIAQSEMVNRFMDGVDPSYRYAEESFLQGLCQDFIDKIVSQLDRYSDAEKERIRRQLSRYGNELLKDFDNGMTDFTKEYFSDPTMDAVSRLPKTELAVMAEALVHLTSLKRKISADPETVTEPIDVAVISKGDGFIWIKRKQYFEAALNPLYFMRRYKELA